MPLNGLPRSSLLDFIPNSQEEGIFFGFKPFLKIYKEVIRHTACTYIYNSGETFKGSIFLIMLLFKIMTLDRWFILRCANFQEVKATCWTLDVSWTASCEITLRLSGCSSVRPSQSFLKIGFSDTLVTDGARFLTKKIGGPNLGQIGTKTRFFVIFSSLVHRFPWNSIQSGR